MCRVCHVCNLTANVLCNSICKALVYLQFPQTTLITWDCCMRHATPWIVVDNWFNKVCLNIACCTACLHKSWVKLVRTLSASWSCTLVVKSAQYRMSSIVCVVCDYPILCLLKRWQPLALHLECFNMGSQSLPNAGHAQGTIPCSHYGQQFCLYEVQAAATRVGAL